MPPTSSHPALAVATPFGLPTWVTCVNPAKLASTRRRLVVNRIGDDAEQALRAAAHIGLQLEL